jgi:uncharacterized protein YjiK
VSEGCGTVDDEAYSLDSPNLLVHLDNMAVIQEVISLPAEVNANQVHCGFKGVAADGDNVLVAFQQAWTNQTSHPSWFFSNTGSSTWKFEGLAVDEVGNVWINTENDSVNGNSGQRLLLNPANIMSITKNKC